MEKAVAIAEEVTLQLEGCPGARPQFQLEQADGLLVYFCLRGDGGEVSQAGVPVAASLGANLAIVAQAPKEDVEEVAHAGQAVVEVAVSRRGSVATVVYQGLVGKAMLSLAAAARQSATS